MKILLYGINFWPEPTGIGKYSGEMAAWLAERGHDVRVVAAPPYYPDWKIGAGYRAAQYRRERWHGVEVWRTPVWIPRNQGGMSRVAHLLSFALASIPALLRQLVWRPDVVFTVAPALTCAPAGWLIARLTGAKAWLHIQDFEVDVAFHMGLLEGARLRSAVLWLERSLLRRFDAVSSISHRMVLRLLAKRVEASRVQYFPNWVDIDTIRPLNGASTYRAELSIAPDTVVALFSGTLSAKQGLMVIPEAARRLQHRTDILFLICGDGAIKPQLHDAVQGLPNVRLLPLQPAERLADLLGMADVHLLPQSAEAEDLVLPSKLTGMLASGRAIVATCRPETEIAGIVGQCGLVVPPEDGSALAAAIERLAADPAGRLALGQSARQIAENTLGRDAVLARILAQMMQQGDTDAAAKAPVRIG